MNGIFWPKNVILVHPGPISDAIIGWTSPVNRTVTVTTTIAKLDRACGEGITWRLSHRTTTPGDGKAKPKTPGPAASPAWSSSGGRAVARPHACAGLQALA